MHLHTGNALRLTIQPANNLTSSSNKKLLSTLIAVPTADIVGQLVSNNLSVDVNEVIFISLSVLDNIALPFDMTHY